MSVLHPSIPHRPAAAPTGSATTTPASPFTLTDEQRAQWAAAKKAAKPIDRAVKIATFTAYSLAVFAALSLPFSFSSWKGAFICNALATCAYFEFRGMIATRRRDPAGPKTLMWNELALGLVILVYCGWSMADAASAPNAYAAALGDDPALAEMLAPYQDAIYHTTLYAYGLVGLLSFAYQGLMAMYYRRVGAKLDRYLKASPEWVRSLESI